VRKRPDEFKREILAFNEELKVVERHYKDKEKLRKTSIQKLKTKLKSDGRFNDEEIKALIRAPRELWEKAFPPKKTK
jgi:hypothetical protein